MLVAALAASLLVVMAGSAGAGAGGGPTPAVAPLGEDGRIQPGPTDRCPVCAMFPARRPEAAAAMTLHSGETFYFCGNGCLLRTWLRPTVHLGQAQGAIDRLVVRDFFSGQDVDGRRAFYVAGSDVVGPMGPAIVTLGEEAHVATFRKRHGGATVFTLDMLDDALWHTISRHRLPAAQVDPTDATAK